MFVLLFVLVTFCSPCLFYFWLSCLSIRVSVNFLRVDYFARFSDNLNHLCIPGINSTCLSFIFVDMDDSSKFIFCLGYLQLHFCTIFLFCFQFSYFLLA